MIESVDYGIGHRLAGGLFTGAKYLTGRL